MSRSGSKLFAASKEKESLFRGVVIAKFQGQVNCHMIMYLSEEIFSCPKGKIMDKHLSLALTVLIPNVNFFGFFGLMLYIPVTSYGHVGTVSSPKHTFFLDKLDQAVNQYLVQILLLVTDNKPS